MFFLWTDSTGHVRADSQTHQPCLKRSYSYLRLVTFALTFQGPCIFRLVRNWDSTSQMSANSAESWETATTAWLIPLGAASSWCLMNPWDEPMVTSIRPLPITSFLRTIPYSPVYWSSGLSYDQPYFVTIGAYIGYRFLFHTFGSTFSLLVLFKPALMVGLTMLSYVLLCSGGFLQAMMNFHCQHRNANQCLANWGLLLRRTDECSIRFSEPRPLDIIIPMHWVQR